MIIEENLKHSTTEELIKLQDCIKKMHTSARQLLKLLNDMNWIAPRIDTKSTICPKCSNVRVADAICWNIGCDYKTVMDAQDE